MTQDYVIHKASDPNWVMQRSGLTLDEVIHELMTHWRAKKFIVDMMPWDGFEKDERGNILRDGNGIGIPKYAGFVDITIYDAYVE